MTYNPLLEVLDEPLSVSDQMLQELVTLRSSEKFTELPGCNTAAEQVRLSTLLNELLDRLVTGISKSPSKLWVMQQFKSSLEAVQMEDTEGREQFGVYLEQVMDILNIDSSDGLLSFYL